MEARPPGVYRGCFWRGVELFAQNIFFCQKMWLKILPVQNVEETFKIVQTVRGTLVHQSPIMLPHDGGQGPYVSKNPYFSRSSVVVNKCERPKPSQIC
jgi:hypothetical protein